MALTEAEKAQLAEIERRLAQDHPDLTRSFPARRGTSGAALLLFAAGVFVAALAVVSVLAGDVLPVLLAVPPVVVAVLLVRNRDLLQSLLAEQPRPARDRGHDRPAG